jgi:hypothetical protein
MLMRGFSVAAHNLAGVNVKLFKKIDDTPQNGQMTYVITSYFQLLNIISQKVKKDFDSADLDGL